MRTIIEKSFNILCIIYYFSNYLPYLYVFFISLYFIQSVPITGNIEHKYTILLLLLLRTDEITIPPISCRRFVLTQRDWLYRLKIENPPHHNIITGRHAAPRCRTTGYGLYPRAYFTVPSFN